MSHPLIDRNEDLQRLRGDGFCVDICGANLVVRDIPYVTAACVLHRDGVLISKLNLAGDIVNQPDDHTIKWSGELPHGSDGQPIGGLGARQDSEQFSSSLVSSYRFSARPTTGQYPSYDRKIRTYVGLISAAANAIDPSATAQTRRVVEPRDERSPFHYLDTASARAEIELITKKLSVERLAIVGLGGTGSYVLDLLAKTPAHEIHLYDGDVFSSHNAFRAPGAASKDELRKQPLKVEYFQERYSAMHKGIIPHPEYVNGTNVQQLREMACVFLCMDATSEKREIVERLEEFGVTFIDTGIGLVAHDSMLSGHVRATTSSPEQRVEPRAQMSFATGVGADLYEKNIQVADVNALCAVLAIIKWKKLRTFYFDTAKEWQVLFGIRSNLVATKGAYEPD